MKEFNKDFVVLQWNEPESDGGSPITSYLCEKKDMKRDAFVKNAEVDSKTLMLKADKLVEGNEYQFRICAENQIGVSDWVMLPQPVTARLPFGM